MTQPQQAASAAALAQASQAGLMIAMEPYLEQAWATVDTRQLATSLPNFRKLIAAIVRRFGPASATLAARYYKQTRAEAVAGKFTVKAAEPAKLDLIGSGVNWATKPLWGPEPDVESAKVLVAGVAERLVLNQGRDTIVNAAQEDKRATGWARIAEPGACSFCALLASRGAVYKAATVTFRAHGHCRCMAEPVFGKYQPSEQVLQWQALYKQVAAGKSGNAARIAFRQALEGRQVGSLAAGKAAVRDRPAEIRAELAALQANLPRVPSESARDFHVTRIAELKRQLAQ